MHIEIKNVIKASISIAATQTKFIYSIKIVVTTSSKIQKEEKNVFFASYKSIISRTKGWAKTEKKSL